MPVTSATARICAGVPYRRAAPAGPTQTPIGSGASAISLQQLGHHVVTDDGAARVDLQHERLRALLVGPFDGVADLVDDDVVEQPADLQHVDRTDVPSSSCAEAPPVADDADNAEQGRSGEEADQ